MITIFALVYKSPETLNSPTNSTSLPSVAWDLTRRYFTTVPSAKLTGSSASTSVPAASALTLAVFVTIADPVSSVVTVTYTTPLSVVTAKSIATPGIGFPLASTTFTRT